MNPCHDCQTKLLDHLYGLLDGAEQRGLLDHLDACADCRAALARAEAQRQAITFAASGQFPEVQFTAPVPRAVARRAEPADSATPRARRLAWGRYALAAGFLLAVGLVGFGGWTWYEQSQEVARLREEQNRAEIARNALAQAQQRERDAALNRIREIQDEIARLEKDWTGTANKVRADYDARDVQIQVTGPKTVQAGAPNVYLINAQRRGGPQANSKAQLVARIVDAESQQELCRQVLRDGPNPWTLPENLPVKPGARLTLVVSEDGPQSAAAWASLVGLAGGPLGAAPLTGAANSAVREAETTRVRETLHLVGSLHVTHLTTDRPMYRPGDTVRFRSLTLERFSLKPAEEDFQLQYRITGKAGEVFKLDGPARVQVDGKEVTGPDGKPLRGLGAGEWTIPDDLPGGEYILTVSDAQNRFPKESRRFLINRYQAPRLNKEIEFTRKSYGPGELVQAVCKVARAEGGAAIDNEPVQVQAQVDGVPCAVLDEGALRVRNGLVLVRVQLPERIERGDASLTVTFRDGGVTEPIVRPIPVVVNRLFVELYPEGGDLVAGIPGRVYFAAKTTLGKPAELRGRIVDQRGTTVARLETLSDEKEPGVNQGMGVFEFTPKLGDTYAVQLDSPIGVEARLATPFPPIKADGVTLTAPGVFQEHLDVTVRGGRERKLLVGAYCRGRLLDHATVTLKPGEPATARLTPAQGIGGVYRVTVFEEVGGKLHHVAERLVYRRPVEDLRLKVTASPETGAPGERVRVSVASRDEKERPAPAVVLLSVVDKSILKLADEKTARAMPTHFFLSTEVRQPEDLEYADFLLSDHPRAAVALDLLLGTQGWRRFAEQKAPQQFRAAQPEKQRPDAERLLMAYGRAAPEVKNPRDLRVAQVDQEFAPKHVGLQQRLAQAEKSDEDRQKAAREALAVVERPAEAAQRAADGAQSDLDAYAARLRNYGLVAAGLLLFAVGVVGIVRGVVRTARELPGATANFGFGAASLLVLVVGGTVALVLSLGGRLDRNVVQMAGVAGRANAPAMGGGMPGFAMDDGAVAKGGAEMPAPPPMAAPKDVAPPRPLAPEAPPFGAVPGGPRPPVRGPLVGQARPPAPGVAIQPMPAPLPPGQGEFAPEPGAPFLPDVDFDGRPNAARRGNHERDLRRQGKYHEVTRQRMNLDGQRVEAVPTAVEPMVVREYAHRHTPSADGFRRDFTETLFWHPVLVVPGGKGAEVTFDLSDAVTRFEVLAWGHTTDGRLGAVSTEIASRLPFSLDFKPPVELSHTDRIKLPVSVRNDTDRSRSVELTAATLKGLTTIGDAKKLFAVDARKGGRQLFDFQPSITEGEAVLGFSAKCDPLGADRLERKFRIVPEGFPIVGSKSDLLEESATHTVVLPRTWIPGTLKVRAEVFPSTLADLQKGLESLLREPCGCFEQSSSSNYPNVMILSYLKESKQSAPEVEARARALMASGYQQLTSFECIPPGAPSTRRGYEWFGQTAPPHEALTAYGLLQFRDMAKLHPVDEAMLARTQKYLLDQRDGSGGFKRNARALDSFGRAPVNVTNAYIVWALTESGCKEDLGKELGALLNEAKGTSDPYFVSLVALSLMNSGRTDDALPLLKSLKQQDDGRLAGARASITMSGGRDLDIEATALTTLAWLRANRPGDFHQSVQKSAKWLGTQRGGFGGYGSTQSTILALKALIAFTKDAQQTRKDSELVLYVGDREVARRAVPAGTRDGIEVSVGDVGALKPGKNSVRVEMKGNQLPHTLSWTYNTLQPANPEAAPVQMTAKLDRKEAAEGESVRLTATVENRSGKGQGMAVAIVGLPAGLEVPEDMRQLKDLARLRDNGTREGEISAFEIRGRELVLYWRSLGPDEKRQVSVDLMCRVPGEYRGPASRSYLYYNADAKYWVEPLALTINPRAE